MAKQKSSISKPKGTRDWYPAMAARRRWLLERWREVSIAHGFEEVDGPMFEQSELYAVKSGEGILGELFQAFSGKSPKDVEAVMETGRGPFALRPEFTPTLARMYAAQASSLPKPCKWFMAGPFFRAERPQRGRLREFLQWNVDVLGLDIPVEQWKAGNGQGLKAEEVARAKARMDAEVIGCCVAFLEHVGLTKNDVQVKINDRTMTTQMALAAGVNERQLQSLLWILDNASKLTEDRIRQELESRNITEEVWNRFLNHQKEFQQRINNDGLDKAIDHFDLDLIQHSGMAHLGVYLDQMGFKPLEWWTVSPMIVRGLAYYTGTVFEVIADGERAVAGGGRYDNLIALFGGPPTPAVGFAMGDVVLGLLLQDKGLMPSDEELLGLVGQQPDVFVLSNGSDDAQAKVQPVVAMLRRSGGGAGGRTLRVRHSYKTTKNIGKLLKEASQVGARFAVILEDAQSCSVKDLQTGTQWDKRVEVDQLADRLGEALGR